MESHKIDNTKTGWDTIPGNTKVIVAHYKDGHTEHLEVWQFIAMGRKRDKIVQIDCYGPDEEIKD